MQLMKTKKSYNLSSLATVAVTFVVIAIVLGMGAKVLTEVGGDLTGTAKDATLNGTEGIAELSSWLPTIALIIAAAVIIGIVVTYFAFRGGR